MSKAIVSSRAEKLREADRLITCAGRHMKAASDICIQTTISPLEHEPMNSIRFHLKWAAHFMGRASRLHDEHVYAFVNRICNPLEKILHKNKKGQKK